MKSTTLCSCSLSNHSGTLGAALQISSFCSAACDKATKRRVRYGGRHILQLFWFAIDRCVAGVDKLLSLLSQILGPMRARPVRPRTQAATSEWPCECVAVWQDKKRRTPSCLKALLGVSRALGREMLLVALSAANMYTMLRTSVHTHYCTDTQPWVL